MARGRASIRANRKRRGGGGPLTPRRQPICLAAGGSIGGAPTHGPPAGVAICPKTKSERDGAMYKRILVPIDLADPDLAKPAVATALMMAGPSEGTIRFVNVLPLTPVMLAEYVPPDFEVQQRKAAEDALAIVVKETGLPSARVSSAPTPATWCATPSARCWWYETERPRRSINRQRSRTSSPGVILMDARSAKIRVTLSRAFFGRLTIPAPTPSARRPVGSGRAGCA